MSSLAPFDYDDIIGRLRGLLVMLGMLSAGERREVEHFIDVGEFGLALETLAYIIIEEDKEIPRRAHDAIRQLAKKMNMVGQIPESLGKHVYPGN